MNNKLYFLSFALGIGVGIYATADYFRAKYKARSDEEIKAVREVYYEKRKEEKTAEKPKPRRAEESEGMRDIKDMLSTIKDTLEPNTGLTKVLAAQAEHDRSLNKYASLAKEYRTETEQHEAPAEDPKKPEEQEPLFAPYVISPDDFGGTFEYDCKSLTYYLDGVLVDEDNNVVKDVEELIGDEALDHIGEYEIDAVHVRNDNLRCDYEILCSDERWVDVKKRWQR